MFLFFLFSFFVYKNKKKEGERCKGGNQMALKKRCKPHKGGIYEFKPIHLAQ